MIDTNLLLLLIVGLSNRSAISRFRRTSQFTVDDFDTVEEIARFFADRQGLSTTPHILTEVSNLLGRGESFRLSLQAFLGMSNEFWERAGVLASYSHFLRFGLADVAILDLSVQSHCVITVDAALTDAISTAGGAVVNYNHIRFTL